MAKVEDIIDCVLSITVITGIAAYSILRYKSSGNELKISHESDNDNVRITEARAKVAEEYIKTHPNATAFDIERIMGDY